MVAAAEAETLGGNPHAFLSKGIRVQFIMAGSAVPRLFLPKMIEWYRQGRFPVDKLVTTFAFADINEAVKATQEGTAIKPVLTHELIEPRYRAASRRRPRRQSRRPASLCAPSVSWYRDHATSAVWYCDSRLQSLATERCLHSRVRTCVAGSHSKGLRMQVIGLTPTSQGELIWQMWSPTRTQGCSSWN